MEQTEEKRVTQLNQQGTLLWFNSGGTTVEPLGWLQAASLEVRHQHTNRCLLVVKPTGARVVSSLSNRTGCEVKPVNHGLKGALRNEKYQESARAEEAQTNVTFIEKNGRNQRWYRGTWVVGMGSAEHESLVLIFAGSRVW